MVFQLHNIANNISRFAMGKWNSLIGIFNTMCSGYSTSISTACFVFSVLCLFQNTLFSACSSNFCKLRQELFTL